MAHAVFVAPYAADATLRFLAAALATDDARIALLTQQPLEALPESVASRLAGHWRIDDALDPEQLAAGATELGRRMGSIDQLLGILEHLQVPLAAARERLGVPGMGVETARNFRDKARMKTVLRQAGFPCARHRLVGDAAEARDFAREVGFPLVLKPPAGAGAKATLRLDDETRLAQTLGFMRPTPASPLLLEEYLIGREQSFECVFAGGAPRWHSLTHYLPTPLDVLRNDWIQWCILLPREVDHPRYDEIRRLAPPALKALGLDTGIAHMEWFERSDGSLAISEVAARPPGAQIVSLTSYAHDFDFYRAWARLMIHGAFDPPQRRYAAGAAFLRGQGGRRVAAVHGLDGAQRELGELVVEARLPQPGQPKADSYEGEGYVILRHPETDVVRRALERLISTVRVEMAS